MLYSQYGISYSVASIFGSILIVVAPFLFLSKESLNNYITWITVVGKQGFLISLFQANLKWLFYYLLTPLVFTFAYLRLINVQRFQRTIHERKNYIYSFLISLVAILIISSVKGADIYYFIPLVPLFPHLFVMVFTDLNIDNQNFDKSINKYIFGVFISIFLGLFISIVLRTAINEKALISLSQKPGFQAINDIENILNSHASTTIGMGYGSNSSYDLTFYRPVLIFSGNPNLVDAAT